MQLKFPHIRLMVYDTLVNEGAGCVQAIVSSAHKLGLIGSNKLTNLELAIETPECGSLLAAEHVLRQCLSEHGHCLNHADKALADRLWLAVQRSVELYKSATSLSHNREPGTVAPIVECSHMAPIVMDFLYQELLPYI